MWNASELEASQERVYGLTSAIGIIRAPFAVYADLKAFGLGDGNQVRFSYLKNEQTIQEQARILISDNEGQLKGCLKKICRENDVAALFKPKDQDCVFLIGPNFLDNFGKWEKGIVEKFIEQTKGEVLIWVDPVHFVTQPTFMNRSAQLL